MPSDDFPVAEAELNPSVEPVEFAALDDVETAPRSLWDLMGNSQPGEVHATPGDVDLDASANDISMSPVGKSRSLWAVMHRTSTSEPDAATRDPEPDDDAAAIENGKLNAQLLSSEDQAESRSDLIEARRDTADIDPDGQTFEAGSKSEAASIPPEVEAAISDTRPVSGNRSASLELRRKSWQRRSMTGLICGVLALGLSTLTLREGDWLGVPSAVLGLAALTFGYFAATDARRLELSPQARFRAWGVVLLGVGGMFAGPCWFGPQGQAARQREIRKGTAGRLTEIGRALSSYHNAQGHYPAGGRFIRVNGIEVGMSSWMTELLPYIGEEELSKRIDRSRPWDDPANIPAMRQSVPAWQIPGLRNEPTPRGFGSSRFAGVGGQDALFDRNSSVKRDDVSDGLTNTLAAGEIARQLPAWGEPENWREIGSGLNRDPLGFGNESGTGAHFLLLDGSVRFFSNRTSPEVLRRMSTCTGGEHLTNP